MTGLADFRPVLEHCSNVLDIRVSLLDDTRPCPRADELGGAASCFRLRHREHATTAPKSHGQALHCSTKTKSTSARLQSRPSTEVAAGNRSIGGYEVLARHHRAEGPVEILPGLLEGHGRFDARFDRRFECRQFF